MPSSPPRRPGLIALTGALATLAVTAFATQPAGAVPTLLSGASRTSQQAQAATGTHQVTLVTGDRVTLTSLPGGRSVATVKRPPGLDGAVQTTTVGKDLYVYPAEAMPYLAAGVLDQRLFNVTRLVAYGYDDAGTSSLPLIVQHAGAARSASAVKGLTTRRALPSIDAEAASVDRDRAAALWQSLTPASSTARATKAAARSAAAPASTSAPVFADGITHIWLDGRVKATLADSTAQVGAPEVWKSGTDGKGVDVAVLDTGIDSEHPDLAGQVDASQSFVPGEEVTDGHGHGTHTASTIAGTGAASDGKEKGVAPGSHLLVGKVLADNGSGDESWIIAGMQWAAQTQHAKVVSMSLGSTDRSDGTDPMSQAVDDLSKATGALFVIAAGNSGAAGIAAPGAATSALTVAAVDGKDNLASFSSWGPRMTDGALKPEISGPGVNILAARSQYAASGSGFYATMSGTSMATPHVAGAAALVAARHPDWTGQQIKDALVSTSHETPAIVTTKGGSGRLDVKAAALGTVHASANAWSGYYPWPHTADQPAPRTITYTNDGDTDITLALKTRTADESGAADSDVFTLSAQTVTVPAHGTASVTVTADPDAAPFGATSGQLEATDTDGTVVAHTLIGIDREDERYNLTLKAFDRTGAPLTGYVNLLRTGDTSAAQVQIPADGELTLRLPAGQYSAAMFADLPGATGPDDLGLALLSAPDIRLDGNREVHLDARQAHRVSATAPQPTVNQMTRIEWNREVAGAHFNETFLVPLSYGSIWAQSTAPVRDGQFSFVARWRQTAPPLTVTATDQHQPDRSFSDLLVQAGSTPLPEGTSHLKAVYAGAGRTADYAGLDARGKAVVVRISRQSTYDAQAAANREQALAAIAAGAKLLLVVNDRPDRFSSWFGEADHATDSPIEIASIQPQEGAALIASAAHTGLRLTVTSTPVSPYVYDLVERHDGTIPAGDLTYRPAKKDLARVDTEFRGPKDGEGYNGRYDLEDFDTNASGFDFAQQLQSNRTDWMTPGKGRFTWYELSGISDVVEERTPLLDRAAGSRTSGAWFSPVIHPRLGDSTLPNRSSNRLRANIPAWGDGGSGNTGYDYGPSDPALDPLHETVSLYQGDALVQTNPRQLNVTLSPDKLPYRLVAETSQTTVFPTSTATRTEWGFTSAAGTGTLPLIQFDYGVTTDRAGNAEHRTTLNLTASHLAGAAGAGTVDSTTLAVSYDDGTTWKPLALKRSSTGWTAAVSAPKSSRYASIRATAHDSAGNTVSQTVVRAFGLQ
ncbi:S8 family serine peptidase [Streptomyces sp. NPDC048200]|uniref:S8 family serine peptidase n=1 Tax=Streptomyces sp. NPDC048200 TaxID=3365512 RepID=UPI00371D047D